MLKSIAFVLLSPHIYAFQDFSMFSSMGRSLNIKEGKTRAIGDTTTAAEQLVNIPRNLFSFLRTTVYVLFLCTHVVNRLSGI